MNRAWLGPRIIALLVGGSGMLAVLYTVTVWLLGWDRLAPSPYFFPVLFVYGAASVASAIGVWRRRTWGVFGLVACLLVPVIGFAAIGWRLGPRLIPGLLLYTLVAALFLLFVRRARSTG